MTIIHGTFDNLTAIKHACFHLDLIVIKAKNHKESQERLQRAYD